MSVPPYAFAGASQGRGVQIVKQRWRESLHLGKGLVWLGSRCDRFAFLGLVVTGVRGGVYIKESFVFNGLRDRSAKSLFLNDISFQLLLPPYHIL